MSSPFHRRDDASTGFTLVEVLIALMIFGLIAAAGVAILTFSVRAQTATGKRFDDLAALNRTTALLAGDLGQAIDRPARDEGGNRLPAFTGEANGQMRFVRTGWTNVDAAPRASVQKVAYALDGDTLQRIAYPMVDGAPPLPPVTLLGNVAGIAARYRYKGAWSDRWDGTQGAALPQAAEIVLRRTDGTALRLMLLVGSGYAPPPLGVPQPAPTATGTPGAT
ncbi:MAG: type II secretion system minor pseudopilin GspJ [Sphingomonas sp.]